MAICPFAIKRLIPPGANDPRIDARLAILHVDAGDTYDLYDYFKYRSGGIESHFMIAKDGTLFQYRDTAHEADANYRANPFAISIETQGYGSGKWTGAQLATIKRLLRWLNKVHHKIKIQVADAWNGSGVGYHIQFGTPGWWTNVAKACPGPDRIKQYWNDIVPWLKAGADQEDDMAQYGKQLDRIETLIRDMKRAAWRRGKRERLKLQEIINQSKDDINRADLEAFLQIMEEEATADAAEDLDEEEEFPK